MAEAAVDHIPVPPGRSVLHLISDAGPHPYFRTLIAHGPWAPEMLTVGCVGPAGHLQEDMRSLGVGTFALGARSRAEFPRAALSLARVLRARGTQVVQTHLVDGCQVGLAAARAARGPLGVMTAHHSHELPFHGPLLRLSDRACGVLCDHVIAPSRAVGETLGALVGVPRAKVAVVHHGFDLRRLDPEAVDGSAVRRELGLEGRVVLGSLGRVYWLKNQEALVQAFASVARERAELALVVAGPGDPEPLRRLAGRLGVAEQVILTGPRQDVPELLGAFDAFVHPALAESFGMVIVEAMAMGRPVLCTPVGIAPEVVAEENGELAEDGSEEALNRGLRRLLERRGQWPAMGRAAREQVSGFTAQAMAAAHEALYARWLGEWP